MCGIIGVFNVENAAELATLGLFAEQHRGQESCGLAVSNGGGFYLRKKMGLVKNVFPAEKLAEMEGYIAVGHVRYPTRGSSTAYNSQPHVAETLAGPGYALASNGDIINYFEIRKELEDKGVFFRSGNDGELILKYIVYHVEAEKLSIEDSIKKLMHNVKGAFSTVLATRENMYIFRDPHAIRPMSYAVLKNGAFAVASESCALDIMQPKWIKEMKPAGIIKIDKSGYYEIENDQSEYTKLGKKHCIFEHIYFSRPDSIDFYERVFEVRERIGAKLAEADDLKPDVVVPVPDSSNYIAIGYAKQKHVPFEFGLIRNHYVGRTFIKPEQTVRDESVTQKFNALPGFFEGKKVVLVDDSIVRGTTLRKIARLVKNAGAKEIHLRIGSPMVKYSCYYGIDTPTKQELIANNMNKEEIRQYLDVDSVEYIDIDDLKKCVGKPADYCNACFTGDYPLEVK